MPPLVLVAEGVETTVALLAAAEDATRLARVEAAWYGVTGQRSGITWHYTQILAGIPAVKPDRMICRFAAESLGLPRVTPAFALEILIAAAAEMGMSPTDLDHAVWQWQPGRK